MNVQKRKNEEKKGKKRIHMHVRPCHHICDHRKKRRMDDKKNLSYPTINRIISTNVTTIIINLTIIYNNIKSTFTYYTIASCAIVWYLKNKNRVIYFVEIKNDLNFLNIDKTMWVCGASSYTKYWA
jgi:energy-converting hydrogenase Eha subunit G